jgi:hypothetical protein
MPLGRILSRPSGTVLAQPACVVHVWPSLARLGLGQCSARGPRPGPARPARARTTAWWRGTRALRRRPHRRNEAAGESTAGPHLRMDGGTAELVGVDGDALAAQRFDGDLRGTTVERSARPRCLENTAVRHTHRHVGRGRRQRVRRSGWRRGQEAAAVRTDVRGPDTGL